MARQDREARTMVAMRQRNPRVVWSRHDGGNPWNNLEGNMRIGQLLGLLAAASEDVRISPFEADDAFAFPRPLDEQGIEFLLGDGSFLWALPSKNHFCGFRRQTEQLQVHQSIIDHHIGASEQLRASQSEQPRVARTRAD